MNLVGSRPVTLERGRSYSWFHDESERHSAGRAPRRSESFEAVSRQSSAGGPTRLV
jgi:hypothetical protein